MAGLLIHGKFTKIHLTSKHGGDSENKCRGNVAMCLRPCRDWTFLLIIGTKRIKEKWENKWGMCHLRTSWGPGNELEVDPLNLMLPPSLGILACFFLSLSLCFFCFLFCFLFFVFVFCGTLRTLHSVEHFRQGWYQTEHFELEPCENALPCCSGSKYQAARQAYWVPHWG